MTHSTGVLQYHRQAPVGELYSMLVFCNLHEREASAVCLKDTAPISSVHDSAYWQSCSQRFIQTCFRGEFPPGIKKFPPDIPRSSILAAARLGWLPPGHPYFPSRYPESR
jgi:hypothetical protein